MLNVNKRNRLGRPLALQVLGVLSGGLQAPAAACDISNSFTPHSFAPAKRLFMAGRGKYGLSIPTGTRPRAGQSGHPGRLQVGTFNPALAPAGLQTGLFRVPPLTGLLARFARPPAKFLLWIFLQGARAEGALFTVPRGLKYKKTSHAPGVRLTPPRSDPARRDSPGKRASASRSSRAPGARGTPTGSDNIARGKRISRSGMSVAPGHLAEQKLAGLRLPIGLSISIRPKRNAFLADLNHQRVPTHWPDGHWYGDGLRANPTLAAKFPLNCRN